MGQPGVGATIVIGAARRIVVGAALVLTALAAASDAVAQDIDWTAVDAVFADLDRSNVPGCALGVVQDGELMYGRGYGLANLDFGIVNNPQTVFRTGSVGKQFTAAAVAIAAHEGHFSLDDPARRWIPELPEYPVEPTIRHLVHHTSGLRDYLTLSYLRGLRNDDWYSTAEARALVARQRELNFTPGSDYLYSNAGYLILGEIIREATGRTLREYAQEKIFDPLGMTHSHFHDDHNHIVPMRATGYAPTEDGFQVSVTTLDMVGDGGVFSSTEDLAKWVHALNTDALIPGLNETLESTVPLTSGEPNNYAFGQGVGDYRGLRMISHGGAFVGYRAQITRFPDEGIGIVGSCNRADAQIGRRVMQVVDVVLADRLTPVVDSESSAGGSDDEEPEPGPVVSPGDYAGTYYSPELDVQYVLSVEGDGVRLRVGAGIDTGVRQEDTDRLVAQNGLILRFEREGGRVTGFRLDAGRVRNLAFERVGG